jgi:hypothetical protein
MMPDRVREKSLLIVTRFDKLTTDRDRSRVLNRLTAEALPDFAAMFPLCLLQALEAGQSDVEAWNASGAGPFADHLIDALRSFKPEPQADAIEADAGVPIEEAVDEAPRPRVVPRRIRPTIDGTRRDRPAADEVEGPQFRTGADDDLLDI